MPSPVGQPNLTISKPLSKQPGHSSHPDGYMIDKEGPDIIFETFLITFKMTVDLAK